MSQLASGKLHFKVVLVKDRFTGERFRIVIDRFIAFSGELYYRSCAGLHTYTIKEWKG